MDAAPYAEIVRRLAKAYGPLYLDLVRPVIDAVGEARSNADVFAELLARLGPDAADPITEFIYLALAYERSHVPTLEGFLHWIEVGDVECPRLEHRHHQQNVFL